jgi:hypothetical protein
MTKRMVHTVDGKRISKSMFEEICKARDCKHTIVGGRALGNHLFTTYDRYDRFLRNHPLTASRHLVNLERDKIWRQRIRQLGSRKAATLNAGKNKLLKGINEAVEKLLGEFEARSFEDQVDLMRSFVSQKMGSVGFFKHIEYGGQFARYEGLAHIDMPKLEADWDKNLSSIIVLPYSCGNTNSLNTCIKLYEWPCNQEESPSIEVHSSIYWSAAVPSLYDYGWDNRVSAWKFI